MCVVWEAGARAHTGSVAGIVQSCSAGGGSATPERALAPRTGASHLEMRALGCCQQGLRVAVPPPKRQRVRLGQAPPKLGWTQATRPCSPGAGGSDSGSAQGIGTAARRQPDPQD